MVITTSELLTASVVRILGCSVAMSMPSSAMACTATGFICSAGSDPAERTSTASPASWRRKPAAICDRPALWIQTNRTDGLSAIRSFSFSLDIEVAQQGGDAGLKFVADVAHSLDRLAVRVGHGPVQVALPGIDRAGVAATHGDDDVRGVHHVVGERLGV